MILGAQHQALVSGDMAHAAAGDMTLDDLFRRAAVQRPLAIALSDPADREAFTGTPPRHLTFIEVDNAVSAIAARLRALGLQTDAVVAYQLPNTVEAVLLLLGILRAGMIAVPLPLLWRRSEIVAALTQAGAAALVAMTHIDDTDHGAIAMQAAADYFPLRHVCAFGGDVPDGVVPLDGVFTERAVASFPAVPRSGNSAAHVAVVTWDTGRDGLVAVPHSHLQLLAGARAAASGHETGGTILAAIPPSSFAGLALAVVPWLLHGSRLVLHHAFDADVFLRQRHDHRCATVLVPGAAVALLAEAGLLASEAGLRTVVALWRAADQWRAAPRWSADPCSDLCIADVLTYGELALAAMARDAGGLPVAPALGDPAATNGDGLAVMRMASGCLAIRGRMVPSGTFPPGAERGVLPFLKVNADGFADTGLPCVVQADGALALNGTAPGVIQIGGYRLALGDVEARVAAADMTATVAALPHGLTGQQLAGQAPNPEAMPEALEHVNPLVAAAFARAA